MYKGAGAEPGSEVAFTLEHQPSTSALSTATTLVASSSTTALSSMGVRTGNSIAATTMIMNSIIDYSVTSSNEDVSIISPSKASKLMLLDKEVEKVMMLGRVIFYHVDSASYEILDVDDSKNYLLPESQV
jgi:predicted acylesterase/phospholipase RssA